MPREYIPRALQPINEGEKTPRLIKYGVGIQVNSKTMGMTHGPFDSIEDLLETVPEPNAYIIRFNADWSETFLWRWAGDRWISMENA